MAEIRVWSIKGLFKKRNAKRFAEMLATSIPADKNKLNDNLDIVVPFKVELHVAYVDPNVDKDIVVV